MWNKHKTEQTLQYPENMPSYGNQIKMQIHKRLLLP